MSIFMSWVVLVLAIIFAIGIVKIITVIKAIEALFTGDKHHK